MSIQSPKHESYQVFWYHRRVNFPWQLLKSGDDIVDNAVSVVSIYGIYKSRIVDEVSFESKQVYSTANDKPSSFVHVNPSVLITRKFTPLVQNDRYYSCHVLWNCRRPTLGWFEGEK